MPRYIDADLIKQKLQEKSINDPTTFINTVLIGLLDDAPTEDVAPKSEFYRVYNELEYLKRSILPRLRIDLQMANTRAYEFDEENDRLRRILNSYALQYGTVTDQQKVIDKAKADVAREIFEEIENALSDNFHADCQMGDVIEDYYDDNLRDDIAELKKKYTEESK